MLATSAQDAMHNLQAIVIDGVKESFHTYQSRLARTLHAIEPYEKWRRGFATTCVQAAVLLNVVEDEWNAMLGLVINDLRHLLRYFTCSI